MTTHRTIANEWAREKSSRERDIAADYWRKRGAARRAACARNFRAYCGTYHRGTFSLPWSGDHLRVIGQVEDVVLRGGLYALAMPRGSGKTAILLRAALWSLLYGHRRFVVLVGATERAAADLLKALKTELTCNERLKDFRQVVYPLWELEGITRRAAGQTFDGEPTRIEWTAQRLTLPCVPGRALDGPDVGGSAVAVASITGALRGMTHTLPSGEAIRPDLVLLDDVQTRESAQSAAQTADRLAVVRGDVLGLAGPGKSISAFAACTVIAPDDLADQILNRETCPEWRGERTKAVYSWPAATALWEEYLRLRAEGLRCGRGTAEATAFYAARRPEMDAGAVVAWPERVRPGELSGVQSMVNLRAEIGEAAFASEYLNSPLRAEGDELPTLTAAEIAAKINRLTRGVVPLAAAHVVAMVDVHDNLLVWAVGGFAPDYTGSLLAYGTYPEQRRHDWTLRQASPTLADRAPGAGREGAILAGLERLTADLCGREWVREDGTRLRVERCLVDSGYVPDVVFAFCRRSPHAAVLMPSRGMGIGPAARPMSEYQRRPGEKHGDHWLLRPLPRRGGRHLIFDAHHWKSFLYARLGVARGDRGGLELFGSDPAAHRLLASHLTAERPVRVQANGRTVDEWKVRPGAGDNHYLDAAVGCLVAASVLGVALPASGAAPRPKQRQRVSYAELQAQARGH